MELAHDPDHTHPKWDPTYCQWCNNDGEVNAHTVLWNANNISHAIQRGAQIPMGYDLLTFVDMVTEFVEGPAHADPAEITDMEIICWCGHSLHYENCVAQGACHVVQNDPSPLSCASRYKDRK